MLCIMILALLALCVVVLTAGALLSVYNKRAADRAVLAQGYKLFGEPPGWLPFFGHLRVLLDQTPEEIEYPISTITKLVKRYGIEGHTYRMIVPGGRTYILTANPGTVVLDGCLGGATGEGDAPCTLAHL